MRAVVLILLLAGCGEVVEDEAPAPFTCPSDVDDAAAFGVRVASFAPGDGGGFGTPEMTLGPPSGLGEANGSLDVVALGDGGSIVIELGADVVDCEGPDLIVFENPFAVGELVYSELGEVSVSPDGETWHAFDCDPESAFPHDGCGGVSYVYAAPDNELDPRDPAVAGGDAFDLADLGIERARFVRIVDLERTNGLRAPPSRGFDLDAVGIVRGHAAP